MNYLYTYTYIDIDRHIYIYTFFYIYTYFFHMPIIKSSSSTHGFFVERLQRFETRTPLGAVQLLPRGHVEKLHPMKKHFVEAVLFSPKKTFKEKCNTVPDVFRMCFTVRCRDVNLRPSFKDPNRNFYEKLHE